MAISYPRIAGVYEDNQGRVLRVTDIDPANRQGRQVQGRVTKTDGNREVTYDYSTTFQTFADIWTKERL